MDRSHYLCYSCLLPLATQIQLPLGQARCGNRSKMSPLQYWKLAILSLLLIVESDLVVLVLLAGV